MSNPLLAEVMRATGSVRSGNLSEATSILRRAVMSRLRGDGHETPPAPAEAQAPASARRASAGIVEDAEVVPAADIAPAREADPVAVPRLDMPSAPEAPSAPDVPPEPAPEPGIVHAEGPGAPPPGASRSPLGVFAGLQGGPRLGLVQARPLRRPLREVLRTLSEGRKALGLTGYLPGLGQGVPEIEIPEGATFLDREHACAAGARRYRLYVPASLAAGEVQGLVVMLHGCKQNPEDFAAGTGMNALAETHRLIVAYPRQTSTDNSLSCWNWFRPGDQERHSGEPAILASLAESLRDEYSVPRDRVFVAGLSAGGAMSAILAETWPDLFAAAGIHSGLARGAANDVVTAFGAMRGDATGGETAGRGPGRIPRLIVFHGASDKTVHPVNAARLLARASDAHGPGEIRRHDGAEGGRGYTRQIVRRSDGTDIEIWMIDGAPHAWSGGDPRGSYTDPAGPDASAEMLRFFLER